MKAVLFFSLLPFLAIGLPTCSSPFGGQRGQQPVVPVQPTGQPGQVQGQAGAFGQGPGFIPGGCPAITEADKQVIISVIAAAMAEDGAKLITYSGGKRGFVLDGIVLSPSAVVPCGVHAEWSAHYIAPVNLDPPPPTLSGRGDFARLPNGQINPDYRASPGAIAFALETTSLR